MARGNNSGIKNGNNSNPDAVLDPYYIHLPENPATVRVTHLFAGDSNYHDWVS